MADDTIQNPEESRRAAEELAKQQVKLADDLKNLQKDARTARSDFSQFRSAMVEMSRSIDRLQNPLASTIAAIGESIATYQQKTKLHQQEIEVTKSKIAGAQQDIIIAKQKATAAKDEQDLADMAYDAAERKLNLEQSILSGLEVRKEQIQEELATGKAAGKTTSELATLNEELAKVKKEEKNVKAREKTASEKLEKRKSEHLDALQAAQDAAKEAESVEKEKNKSIEDLNKALQKQEKELSAEKWRQLSNIASQVSKALQDFLATIRDTQNKLGISSSNAVGVIMGNFGKSLQSFFTDLTTVSSKEILAQQEAFQEQFGGVLTSGAAKNLAIQAKELGVTGAQLASARRVFMTSTMGNLGQAQSQQEQFLATFRQQGLTNKDAMTAIAQYSELYARNGTRFADSFARAAIEAKKIGVDLGKIDQVGDNIIGDFEGFLEKTAELGAMGFNLDASRLGEVAESGDTGALMTELRSQLASTGKDLQNLRRSEQLALSNAFGIPMAELQRMAGPTAGSGEETTLQEKAIGIITWIADKIGIISASISAILGLAGGAQLALLSRIAINTGGGGIGSMVTGTFGKIKGFFGGGGESIMPGAPSDAMRKALELRRANPTLSAADALRQARGGGASIASTAAAAAPVGGGADAATGGISKLSKIDGNSLIKGAAALVIMAGALFLMGKALQQFKDVSAGDLGVAIGAIAALTLAMLALGALMTSGIGAAAVFAGIGAITLMAGAVYLLGKALQSVGDSAEGIGTLGTSFDSLATAMARFNEVELNGDNVKKIKELATPTLGENIANAAKSVEALFTSAIAEGKTEETAAPAIDFTRLEAKLDQVVRAIGSMEVKMDATRVGEIIVTNARKNSQQGANGRGALSNT